MPVAALAVVHEQPAPTPPPGRTNSPAPGVALSLTSTIASLRDLDVTIDIGDPADDRLARWSSDTRTLVVHPDATLQQTLWVLRDLYGLHITAGHVSPSRVERQLQVVP